MTAILSGQRLAPAVSYVPIELGAVGEGAGTYLQVNGAGQIAGEIYVPDGVSAFFYEHPGPAALLRPDIEQNSYCARINNAGTVLVSSFDAAYLWSNGSFTNLGTLGGQTYGVDLNDNGQATGYSCVQVGTSEKQRAFRYSAGILEDLGTIGTYESAGLAINAGGDVVGSLALTSYYGWAPYSFVCLAGQAMQQLPTLGGSNNLVLTINSARQIAGNSQVAGNSAYQGYIYTPGGSITSIGTLGGAGSQAAAMNASGVVVGSADTLDNEYRHAVMYDGTLTDLGALPGGNISIATAINDAGLIVGWSEVPGVPPVEAQFLTHAFVYENGVMIDLNDFMPANSPYFLTEVHSISDSGHILATGLDSNGFTTMFLLNPVPEPASALLMVAAAGFLGRRNRRPA